MKIKSNKNKNLKRMKNLKEVMKKNKYFYLKITEKKY